MASSTSSWSRSARGAAALALLAFAWTARAAPGPATGSAANKAAAEAKLGEGVELLKTRSYRDALERFEAAYALVPSPLIFYDFGLAHLGLGDDAHALESFDLFLAEAPDAPSDKRRKAERHRDDLRPHIAIVALEADVGAANLTVDGLGRGQVSFPRRLYLAPGPHQVVVRAGDATETTTITGVAGETLTVAVHLPPPVPPAVGARAAERPPPASAPPPVEGPPGPAAVEVLQAPAPSSASWARPWALSAAAVGAVSIGVGIAFGLAARSDGEAVTGESQSRATFTPDVQSAGLRDQRLEAVFLAVGTAALVAGVSLYVWARHHGDGGRAAEGAP